MRRIQTAALHCIMQLAKALHRLHLRYCVAVITGIRSRPRAPEGCGDTTFVLLVSPYFQQGQAFYNPVLQPLFGGAETAPVSDVAAKLTYQGRKFVTQETCAGSAAFGAKLESSAMRRFTDEP